MGALFEGAGWCKGVEKGRWRVKRGLCARLGYEGRMTREEGLREMAFGDGSYTSREAPPAGTSP
jgi:hypothetical protein